MNTNPRSIEMRNRLELINVAFELGYIAFLPVVDEGIDLLLYREKDEKLIKVQLKGRWKIERKYFGRNIWMAFHEKGSWYLAPHDMMVRMTKELDFGLQTWETRGGYSVSPMSGRLREAMQEYVFPPSAR